MFRGFNHQRIVVVKMETVHSRFTLTQRKVLRGERPEFLSYCLSCYSLLSLSLSCRSSSSLVGSTSVSWFTVYGWWREGLGLLECWHVPIRATVLHYSISARKKQQKTKIIPNKNWGYIQCHLVAIQYITCCEKVCNFYLFWDKNHICVITLFTKITAPRYHIKESTSIK